jgi:predicted dienelactone hydrolase
MQRVSVSVSAIVSVILAVACSSKPQTPPATTTGGSFTAGTSYSAGPGPNPVGVIPRAMLHDGQRNKDLEMSIEYPTRNGPYPVVIFSHAFGGSNTNYVALTEYWTSHGYVCIRPKHADAGAVSDPKIALAEWRKQSETNWRDRARDVTFIIDSLGALEEKYPELRDRMDHGRIGVGGHAYGAFTTMLLAGTKVFGSGATFSVADTRIKAAIAMSPQGAGDAPGLTAESWRDVHVPILYMSGTLDTLGDGDDAARRHDAFQYSPAGDKYFVSIEGARTQSFLGRFDLTDDDLRRAPTGSAPYFRDPRDPIDPNYPQNYPQDYQNPMRGSGPAYGRERRIFNTIKGTTRAFWDAYLKDNKNGREFLASPGLRSDAGTTGAVEVK